MKVILVLSLFALNAFAAIPPKKIVQEPILSALKSKPPQRLQVLRAQGKEGIKQLRTIAFNTALPVESRWKALTTLARIADKESLPDLERAVQSTDWFMRDAALKSFENVDKSQAKRWARHLASDPALVVRTSAVGTLKRLKDKDSADLLWDRLYSAQNYRGNQSLWIRRHIVEALSTFAKKGEEEKFKKILTDKDKTLYKPALAALDKLKKIN